ncbi:MAG: hypothetical protein AB7K09_17800 [Planctomycetota bacterium]
MTITTDRFRRAVVAAMICGLLLTGCRAIAAGIVVGAVAGFVVAEAVYDPPPHYTMHVGHYYYGGHWHPHAPTIEVEYYYYHGRWYRSSHYHGHRHHSPWHD